MAITIVVPVSRRFMSQSHNPVIVRKYIKLFNRADKCHTRSRELLIAPGLLMSAVIMMTPVFLWPLFISIIDVFPVESLLLPIDRHISRGRT